jgi:hypothetical protein
MVYCFIGHLNPASDRQQDGFKRLEELVTVAVQYIKRGAPDVGEGSFVHRLDKVDTSHGIDSLHHHALLSVIAFCFLQDLRTRRGGKEGYTSATPAAPGTTAKPLAA